MKKVNKILLVDDDEVCNYLTEMLIRDLNVSEEVYIATNGEEALSFIKKNCRQNGELGQGYCPELILLDINMPVMDGFEFLEEYKSLPCANDKNKKVILLTSSSNKKDLEKAKNFNIAGYINKPLTSEKILAIFN